MQNVGAATILWLGDLIDNLKEELGFLLQERRQLAAAKDFVQRVKPELAGAQTGKSGNKVGIPNRVRLQQRFASAFRLEENRMGGLLGG